MFPAPVFRSHIVLRELDLKIHSNGDDDDPAYVSLFDCHQLFTFETSPGGVKMLS